ncbi:hypothetical protein DNTS_021322 [Danionella cerebrum]|uniref:BEN domain-containing protein n=1 Tax=Danionella cerebrum TaxID=2873325 RepID=A0A553MNZ7_9TELE|nr:hypothetical protein DNTS_021322 [Danionella translucida]
MLKMTDRVSSSDAKSCSRGNIDEEEVIVKLEEEDMDLSIFAPIEFSECEEDEDEDHNFLSDSSSVSTWRRNFRDVKEEPVPFVTRAISPEEQSFYHAAPSSDTALVPAEKSGLASAISPLLATEPPEFPIAPEQSKSVVGEDQQSLLIEVLNHCRFLNAAVQRLEQKIDRHLSSEPPCEKNPAKRKRTSKTPANYLPYLSPRQITTEGQISTSLAQRLGPPVKGEAGEGAEEEDNEDVDPTSIFNLTELLLHYLRDLLETRTLLHQMSPRLYWVMIGSSLRKVWIPMSVYKEVFKEIKPQRAVAPVLHALFPISTLSCSAITGNPAKGIQQLDPNKIEALREFLAQMYPQFDFSFRGVSWAQCLGVINRIIKNLRKTAEKE